MEDYDKSRLTTIHAMVSFTETLPKNAIIESSNGSNSKHATLGENIVYFTLNLILAHTWKNEADEQALEEIGSILGMLDTDTARPQDWDALFIANKHLGDYIEKLRR